MAPFLLKTAMRPGLLSGLSSVGLRARIYGNFEAFAEAAFQRTLSGQ